MHSYRRPAVTTADISDAHGGKRPEFAYTQLGCASGTGHLQLYKVTNRVWDQAQEA
jgi:hypothetical protein